MTAELTERFTEPCPGQPDCTSSQTRKASPDPLRGTSVGGGGPGLGTWRRRGRSHRRLAARRDRRSRGQPTRQQIAERFGPRVAAIVEGATETDLQPKPPWRERKEAHLAHLAGADRSVQLVVAADKLHNVRSLLADQRRLGEHGLVPFPRRQGGTLWYFRQVDGIAAAGSGRI